MGRHVELLFSDGSGIDVFIPESGDDISSLDDKVIALLPMSDIRKIAAASVPATSTESDGSLRVNRYEDLPSPETVNSGVIFIVVNDPLEELNGSHLALGSDIGEPATSYKQLNI